MHTENNENRTTYSFQNNNEKDVELFCGIEFHANSDIRGIGGIYKHSHKDFIVKEITKEGKILEIKEDSPSIPFSEESKDKYTTFNLIKVNKDTFEAIDEIKRTLKIPFQNQIYYSGLKDKTSISVQQVSIKGDFVEQLKKINIRNLFVRNIVPTKKPVKIGSHIGNHFTITIRNIEPRKNLKKDIKELFSNLTEWGFPNYFGLQRFGTFRPNSHLVGRYLLEKDYERAYNEFVLTTYSTESMESIAVRNSLRMGGDLKKAYEDFPRSLSYERAMIKYLIEQPGDYQGAMNTLPADLKNLLLNSFQSYLFNRMISLRAKKGISLFKPTKGDVICILDEENGNITDIKYIYGGFYDKHLEKAMKLKRAHIVVPIIGIDTNLEGFPLMKSFFEEIIKQENMNVPLLKKSLLEMAEFKGSLRTLTVKPIGLKMKDLSLDDLFPGKKKLKFEFSLQRGSYATMLLRELLK